MEQEDLLLLIRDHLLEMKVQLQLQLQLQDELLLRKIKEQDGFYPMINLLNMHL